MRLKVRLRLERETPGAVRFMEVNPAGQRKGITDSVIGTLYVRKEHFGGQPPQELFVTVSDRRSTS